MKYFVVILSSTPAWADNHWKQKSLNFEQHIQTLNQRKSAQLKAKIKHIRYKQKLRLEKSKLKRALLENQLQTNNREKAQKLLRLFINPKKENKDKVKRNFIKNRNKSKSLKKKYQIPLEDQLFP